MTSGQFVFHVETVQKAFRRFLTALCCGDSSLADDIAQESFIKAWLAIDEISDVGKFRPWIFRIGYNTFINHRRGGKTFVDYEHVAGMEADLSADGSFDYQELYCALARIPLKERMSLLLHYIEGYSVREISEITEASESAVKQHLSRGRKHLRENMKMDL